MKKSPPVKQNGNALANAALAALEQIEREAEDKKRTQLASLGKAREEIENRIAELQHQLDQIAKVTERVTGKPAVKRQRRSLDEVRSRVLNWLEAHRGEKFAAGKLASEFPELAEMPISVALKPLITDGRISRDDTEGVRRAKYFVHA